MSKPKIYVFTSDCFMKEATVLEDTVFIVVPNSQYHIINHDKYGEIKIDNSHLDNLLQSGTIIDYPEPKDLKNPSYSIETLVKERDKLKLELERTEDAFEQMTFRRMENGKELKKERDANFQIAAKLKSAEKDLEGMKSKPTDDPIRRQLWCDVFNSHHDFRIIVDAAKYANLAIDEYDKLFNQ